MEDSETASEVTLPNRKLPSFEASADITLYSHIFQCFCCSKQKICEYLADYIN